MRKLRYILRTLGYVHAAEFLPELHGKHLTDAIAAWEAYAKHKGISL